jgi:predicted AAA+ superfamily ATPase
MDETKVLETLRRMNRWWADGRVPRELSKDFKRKEFDKALEMLGLQRMLIIIGARRVGKTVLMHQLIENLLKKENKGNIMYAQLDHPNLRNLELEELMDIFKKHLRPKGEIFIFLDEIQYIDDWSLWLKSFYDRKEPIKFVLSGSAASTLKKDSESLLGRSAEIELHPFSFDEFARYRGFRTSLKSGIENLWGTDLKEYLGYKEWAEPLFNEYIRRGGFPETFEIESTDVSEELLREDITNKAIYRDIVSVYGIKNPELLEGVFTYLCFNSSGILNKDNASGDLGIDKVTLSSYLGYLNATFLAYEAKNYSQNIKRSLGSMSRFYVCDPGLINSITSYGETLFIDQNKIGMLMETMVFNRCFIYAKQKGGKVFYWRDKQKHEVDVVMKLGKKVIPIEVKYRSKIGTKDVKGLGKFMKGFKVERGIVVTKDLFKEEGGILYIPAWLFLLGL